jgi:ADP-heptose:LPS heptosyltransferase
MIKADCVYFRGDKPCEFKRLCEECPHYLPFPKRVLIIKGRAQGDVLRTTALLPGLKRKFPQSHISWLVDEESIELLLHNPYLDRIISFRPEDILAFLVEKFDVLISLDKESPSTSLATKIFCPQKFGFGMNEYGNLTIFNKASEYAYRLGVDDDLKFSQNKKTYQEIIYEIAEIENKNDEYVFSLKEEDQKKAKEFFKKNKISKNKLAIGLNTGAGTKFETKQWPKERYLELIDHLSTQLKANVFLLGGPREKKFNQSLEKKSRHGVYNTGSENSLLEFAGFISLLDVVVSSDTLGMHLAIGLGKKVIALFGPTCPQEIDLYGKGTKLFAGASCAPCYKQSCSDMRCMKDITAKQVFEEMKKII